MNWNLAARLLAKTVWTPGRIDTVLGETLTSLTKVARLFDTHCVRLTIDDRQCTAWGQYLDDSHFSSEQWGFYGTSSGLQTLGARARQLKQKPSDHVSVTRSLVLPDDRSTTLEVFQDKRDKKDFDNVVKLAFIADALVLDDPENVPTAETPTLVRDLIALAVDGQAWSTRLPEDHDRLTKDRDFPTALTVSVLRRYEAFRDDPSWGRSRLWLADRVLNDGAFREQTTLLALTALALLPHPRVPADDPKSVTDALERCERDLIDGYMERAPG